MTEREICRRQGELDVAQGALKLAQVRWEDVMDAAMPYIRNGELIPKEIREEVIAASDALADARYAFEKAKDAFLSPVPLPKFRRGGAIIRQLNQNPEDTLVLPPDGKAQGKEPGDVRLDETEAAKAAGRNTRRYCSTPEEPCKFADSDAGELITAEDVANYAKNRGVFRWEIAKEMGVTEARVQRWMTNILLDQLIGRKIVDTIEVIADRKGNGK